MPEIMVHIMYFAPSYRDPVEGSYLIRALNEIFRYLPDQQDVKVVCCHPSKMNFEYFDERPTSKKPYYQI